MMIGSLVLSISSMGVATFAWFTTMKMPSLIIANGDLKINSVSLTYYRWEFTKINGYLSPTAINTGDGVFINGTIAYDASGTKTTSGDSDAFTMNMYDPYLKKVYASTDFDLRTNSFIKMDVSLTTSCDFDFSLKAFLDASFTPSTHQDKLSSFITFKHLSGSAITPSEYADDQTLYSAFKAAFKTNYTADPLSFVSPSTSLTVLSSPSVMGGQVPASQDVTLSYWLCFDYDESKLDEAYSGIDFYASSYTLLQDFYFSFVGEQIDL
jgi:hypothetical protein